MEQVELFALACIEPSNYGRAISHWTERELADEMVKQCIVESISHVMWDDYFKRRNSNHTRSVTGPPPDEVDAKVSDITQLYMRVQLSEVARTHRVYR